MKLEKFHAPAVVFTLDDMARCRAIAAQHLDEVNQIAIAVAAETGIGLREIYGNRRTKQIAQARQLVMYLAHRAGMPLAAIGRALSRDHTTILHGVRTEQKRRNEAAQTLVNGGEI